jgi:hypothetical protein
VTNAYIPYRAIVRGTPHLVRPAVDEETGNYTLELGDARIHVDHPADLLAAVTDGEEVTADFETFSLTVRRAEDGRPRYRASAQGVTGPEDKDEEIACWRLLDLLGDENAPVACFFCLWSEVEPSTGWGNLGCAIKYADTYHDIATSTDTRRRKYGPSGMLDWVTEWHRCERFEVRPYGYGYRGRPTGR